MILSRRTLLTGTAALSAAAAAPAWAARWSSAASDWSLATADVESDIAPRSMRLVHGRAPAGLSGALFRNGPAKFRRPGGSADHWFDGDGLIRRFHIREDGVELAARFADTPKRRQEARLGAMVMPGFGSVGDPRAEIGSPDDANAANTSVIPVGDAVWALWEAGSPLAMDAGTLETRGFVTLRPDLAGMPFLAHPRIEPDGRIWNLGVGGDRAMVWRLGRDGALEAAEMIDLPAASYIHDFTATARHLVIVLQPWIRTRQTIPFADGFEWLPEQGTRVLVVDKDDLSRRRLFELPAFGFFHVGDAWESSDGAIRFDVCVYPDMDFAAQGAREVINGAPLGGAAARLAFVTLGADGRAALERTSIIAEFPRSDPRRAGLDRRLTSHTALEHPDRPFAQGVGVQDWASGRSDLYDFGSDHVAEEMVFVPRPGGSGEAGSWLVGPSINLAEGATELHVFDAGNVAAGPLATWRADIAMPASFHGAWRAS